jgi:predicted TIM-barrel fold metal-dependent hydrolase
LGVSKKVGEIININSIAHARAHTLERVDRSQRRECISYKIRGLPLRPEDSVGAGARRRVLADITNKKANKEVKYTRKAQKKCAQCNVPLCIHRECWDVYYRAKKFS